MSRAKKVTDPDKPDSGGIDRSFKYVAEQTSPDYRLQGTAIFESLG